MMKDDYKVQRRSAKDIEAVTLAWRDTLGIENAWAPDMVRLLENKLPLLFKNFSLGVKPASEMGEAEAYTEFNPPEIVVSQPVYDLARKQHGRSRMTLAHELGHLVMHPGAVKFRTEFLTKPTEFNYSESAEWQARKFASLFLMPTHVIREFASVAQIVECCKVSRSAAEVRFLELGLGQKPLPDCVRDVLFPPKSGR
jgi:hypothetical protein